MTTSEFEELRLQFLQGTATGAARARMIERLHQHQEDVVRAEEREAKRVTEELIARASANRGTT